jgi:farnesyl diphosphate synthase
MDARVSDPLSSREFSARLDAIAAETDALLDRLLDGKPAAGEVARPPRLLEAMRYASLGGGKRLRPFLLVETANLFGTPRANALMAGAALECVHCYSLVHDDLPAMDDDELRRGRPTVHKAFDEATAILTGDALLTFAFDLMARPDVHPDPQIRLALVTELARAAGLGGMAGGQMLDLAAEGRFAEKRKSDEASVTVLQAMKTGALIRFACRAGAIIGHADAVAREAVDRYGRAVGQAFQIADDLLDLSGDTKMMGKSAGKDAVAGKATLPGVMGATATRARLKTLVAEADEALKPFAEKGSVLGAAARFVAERRM